VQAWFCRLVGRRARDWPHAFLNNGLRLLNAAAASPILRRLSLPYRSGDKLLPMSGTSLSGVDAISR